VNLRSGLGITQNRRSERYGDKTSRSRQVDPIMPGPEPYKTCRAL
jgi:hypothetical protein